MFRVLAGSTAVAIVCVLLAVAAVAQDRPSIPAWVEKRADEPFDVKQFLTTQVKPEDNAAPLYLAGLAKISGAFNDSQGREVEKQIANLSLEEKITAGAITKKELDSVLAATAAAIRQIDAAQAKPACQFQSQYTLDEMLYHAEACRGLARLSMLHLYHARYNRDFALAATTVRRLLRASRDLQHRGVLVCQIVSIAIDDVLYTCLENVTLNDPALTAEQCEQLISLLAEHERSVDRMRQGLQSEYVVVRNTLHELQTGKRTVKYLLELVGPETGNGIPADLQPDYKVEIQSCNRLFQLGLQAADQSIGAEAWRPVEEELSRLREKTKASVGKSTAGIPILSLFLAPAFNAVAEADRRSHTQVAGLQLLLALRKYELTHRHLPVDLDAAAAQTVLKSVPRDPYGSGPMRLVVVDGKPVVYSIGKDGKDDGGLVDYKMGTQDGDYLFVLQLRPGTNLTPPSPAGTAPPASSAPKSSATANPPAKDAAAKKPASGPMFRTWTSVVGTKLEAEFLGLQDGIVTLKRRSGTNLKLPLEQLSDQDRKWIRDQK